MTKEFDYKSLNETEAKILQAAEDEFMAKGFAGARTTSIADAAGVTHAMFHYYFRTKEKLFERIISEKVYILQEVISQSFKDVCLPLEDMIRNLINLHLDFISDNPGLPRFLICEVFGNPDRLAVFSQTIKIVASEILSRLQSKIDDEASKGLCRKVDAHMLMLDIVSLNVFPYIATPLIDIVLDNCMADASVFLEKRKKENFNTIMQKLRP